MAWLEIDLAALVDNLRVVRDLAGTGVPVHPVVKADAYGHGALPVARALETAGADGLCVATADEALALRAGGIRGPILVLYPVPEAMAPELGRRRVTVTAGDLDLLAALVSRCAREPAAARRLALHLEVETGLGRGGFREADLRAAADLVASSPGLRLAGLWTHLQAPEDAERTAGQLARFDAAVAALRRAGHRTGQRHVAPSGGLLLGNTPSLDRVRPGLDVYGLVPDALIARHLSAAQRLRPVMSLRARPVRVVELPAGWGISYGPSFVTARPSRIATLPLGYGDGWPRSLSNRAEALVRGHRVPLVGTVAMDAVMADVTDVPDPPVTVADEFVLLGRQGDESITAAELAKARSTISYEVVTAMAARLPRVYHAPSGALGVRTLVSRPGATIGAGPTRRTKRS
ncbi:MAG TPA: alanine racemase [Candidatus Limnocylindrales bacterium]|nr:alanine racemase [Candidatus Limnocylindrales bacterium]